MGCSCGAPPAVRAARNTLRQTSRILGAIANAPAKSNEPKNLEAQKADEEKRVAQKLKRDVLLRALSSP